jgi:leader peptidase (prepilin peptidase)/N-methyltransferase
MQLPEPWVSIYLFAMGLVLGSFVNVCILRLPVGQSIVRPRSSCPACKAPIRWYQNVPLLSWLALRGRCASCAARISWRYPFVEVLCGSIVWAMWRLYGPSAAFPIAAFFGLALVALFYTDLDHQLLPDAITLSGLVLGLVVAWFNPFLPGASGWARVWTSLSGAALGSGILWGIGALYGRLRGVEAMGMGDVKMMGMVGAFTGPFGVLFTIFAASAVGAVVGVLLIPLRGRSLQDSLPFGCFLAPASMAAMLAGRQVGEAYLRLLIPGS